MIRIIIAEDHHIVRKGIRLLLSEDTELQVVAEASNGQEALDALGTHPGVEIVLADLNMPVMDGHTLLTELKSKYPAVKLILLSMVDDHKIIAGLIGEGASGYLFKNCDAMELAFAIKFVYDGSRYICADLGTGLLETLRKHDETLSPQDRSDYTDRELQILQLIAEGMTNNEIAEKIFVSKRTVEGHRQSLLDKTGSRNTAVLIRNAALRKLI
jgi:DNA-binding NarL/FixJ family response regulator